MCQLTTKTKITLFMNMLPAVQYCKAKKIKSRLLSKSKISKSTEWPCITWSLKCVNVFLNSFLLWIQIISKRNVLSKWMHVRRTYLGAAVLTEDAVNNFFMFLLLMYVISYQCTPSYHHCALVLTIDCNWNDLGKFR